MEKVRELEMVIEGRGEKKGYSLVQILKGKNAYVYWVEVDGEVNHYEVFRRKINKRFGVVSYPKSKSFGKWAWTCMSLWGYRKKFNELEFKEED